MQTRLEPEHKRLLLAALVFMIIVGLYVIPSYDFRSMRGGVVLSISQYQRGVEIDELQIYYDQRAALIPRPTDEHAKIAIIDTRIPDDLWEQIAIVRNSWCDIRPQDGSIRKKDRYLEIQVGCSLAPGLIFVLEPSDLPAPIITLYQLMAE